MKETLATLLLTVVLMASLQAGQNSSPARDSEEDVNQLISRGDYEAADRVFAAELAHHPGDFRLTYNRALANYLAGHLEGSRDLLLSVSAAGAGQSNYQALLASGLTDRGDYHGALAPSIKVLKLAPSDANNWLRLAALYLRMKKGQHALEVYRAGQARFPNRPEFLIGPGVIEEMQERLDVAIETYRGVTQKYPRQESAYQFLGHALIKAGKAADAEETAKKLLKLNPRSAYGEYLLGEAAWLSPGRKAEAAAHAEQALRLDPHLVEALLLAAKVELRSGNPQQAVSFLQRAIQEAPRVETSHYLLAQAYRQVGDLRQADLELKAFRALRQSEDHENQLLGNFLATGTVRRQPTSRR